jgi:hypothetical protein
MSQKYEELKARLEDLKKQVQEAAKEFFADGSKTFFEEHPTIESFGWAQYTPYFNDGDPCYFGVNRDREAVFVNDVRGYDVDTGVAWPGYNAPQAQKDAYVKAVDEALVDYQAVEDFLSVFSEDDLEEMFGDHIKVTVYRDGRCETTDYEHD